MPADSFGPIVGPHTIQAAIIGVLSQPPQDGQAALIVYTLAELERENDLPARTIPVPPAEDSYYGGDDFNSWVEALLPSIIVNTQPVGAPERHEGGEYGQWFESQVAAVVQGDDEDQAHLIAQLYGAAVMKAVLAFGSLGGVADETHMTGAPKTEFTDNPARVFQRSVTTFQSYVQPIVISGAVPPTWAYDPYAVPGDYPEITSTHVNFTAETDE